MSLTFKEKELVNIGASVATGCKPCTDFHFKKVREAGASDEEIKRALSYAMAVCDSAKEIMERHGLEHLGMTKDQEEPYRAGSTTRVEALVSIAAAFAVNCTSNLEKHVAISRSVGITEDEITAVLDATSFIKGEASHYVEEIVKLEEKNIRLQQLLDELKATQAQLVQSEKMAALGKLVASVVHEMNTPLGALNSAIDISGRSVTNILETIQKSRTLEEVKNSRMLRDSLNALQTNRPVTLAASERLSNMVSSLKSFAHLDAATVQDTDLHEGLDNTLTLMERELKDRIHVVREYGDIPRVICHPGDLNQAFMNLLVNAAQAIEGKGEITIRTSLKNGNVQVEIADTGVGIPPARMQRLFDPDLTKTGSRVKAGLGLFTSYNIVQKHQGLLTVKSQVGKGTTFTIILPVDIGGSTSSESQAPDKPAHRCDRLET